MGSGIPFQFKETVSAVTATKPTYIDLGTVRYEGGREYVYVYNGGGEQIAPTYGAVLQSGATGYTVTITSVASYGVALGIVREATITTGTYGWLMKRGITTFEAAATTSFQASRGITIGAAGVFENTASQITGGTGTTITPLPVVGVSIGSFASGGSGVGYFNFP